MGIYNPLYLNFPELTSIQTAVDRWNETTEETIAQFDQVYFVPINDLLYKGIDGKMGVSEISDGKTTVINDALYEEDSFHSNNTGYEKMKQAILEKINATKENLESKIIPSTRRSPSFKKINIWKWLFLGLVSLLLAFALVVQGSLATPREDVSQLHQAVGTKDVKSWNHDNDS